jgi:hypothetical protein
MRRLAECQQRRSIGHRSYQSRAIRTLFLLEGVLASGIGQDRLTAAGNGKRMYANPSERRVGRDPMSRARRIADHLRSTFRACRRPADLAAHVGSLSSGRCAGIEGQSLSVCTCSAAALVANSLPSPVKSNGTIQDCIIQAARTEYSNTASNYNRRCRRTREAIGDQSHSATHYMLGLLRPTTVGQSRATLSLISP